MVVRIWTARAAAPRQHAYSEYFSRTVLPQLRAIEGFVDASLLKEKKDGNVEFLVMTKWSSMDAVRVFAGDDVSLAVVEPEAVAALLDYDRTVRHYEVVEDASGPS